MSSRGSLVDNVRQPTRSSSRRSSRSSNRNDLEEQVARPTATTSHPTTSSILELHKKLFYKSVPAAFIIACIPAIGTCLVFFCASMLPTRHGGFAKAAIGSTGYWLGGLLSMSWLIVAALIQLPQSTDGGLKWVGAIQGVTAPIVLVGLWTTGTFVCWITLVAGCILKPPPEVPRVIPMTPGGTWRREEDTHDRAPAYGGASPPPYIDPPRYSGIIPHPDLQLHVRRSSSLERERQSTSSDSEGVAENVATRRLVGRSSSARPGSDRRPSSLFSIVGRGGERRSW